MTTLIRQERLRTEGSSIDDTLNPTLHDASAVTLKDTVDYICSQIALITGESRWEDTPASDLTTLNTSAHDALSLDASATVAGMSLAGQVLSHQAASGAQNGYLTAADWTTFNSKSDYADPITTRGDIIVGNAGGVASRLAVGGANEVLRSNGTDAYWGTVPGAHDAVTLAASATLGGLSLSTQEIGFQPATVGQNGYLTAADWATFNSKSDYADPLTTNGDVLVRAGGVTTRLALGAVDQVLLSDGLNVVWGAVPDRHSAVTLHANAVAGGLSLSGQEIRFRPATTVQSGYLTSVDWNTFNAKSDYNDPLTTNGDLVLRSGGVTTRLPVGLNDQFLRVVAGVPTWQTVALVHNPVTLNATALAAGLSLSVQDISYQAASAAQNGYLTAADWSIFNNKSDYGDPLSVNGDLLVRAGGVTTSLPVGSADQVLTVVGGAPAWADIPDFIPIFDLPATLTATPGFGEGDFVYVESTETLYRYETNGGGWTPSNWHVLATAAGGNTRWLGVAGKYHHDDLWTLGMVRLEGSTSGFFSIRAAAVTADRQYIWPNADGAAGEVLTTDGVGNLSWVAAGGALIDPMTTRGDIIYRDPTNTTDRLGVGAAGEVLTTDGTDVMWGSVPGAHNPVTLGATPGGLSLAVQVLDNMPASAVQDGYLTSADWTTFNSKSDYVDPLTTNGDLLVRSGGLTVRLPVGTNGYILKVVAGAPTWAAESPGFLDPMTTRGDIIYRDPTNTTDRLAVGANEEVLQSDGTDLSWGAVPGRHDAVTLAASATTGGLSLATQEIGFQPATTAQNGYLTSVDWNTFNNKSDYADPLTTRGDVLYRDPTNTTNRLAVGGNEEVLQSDGTDVSWGAVPGRHDAVTLGGTPGGLVLVGQQINNTQASGAQDGYLSSADWTTFNNKSDYADPLTTRGDLLVRDAVSTTRIAIGTANDVLVTDGTDPSWGKIIDANVDTAAGISWSKLATSGGNRIMQTNAFGNISTVTDVPISGEYLRYNAGVYEWASGAGLDHSALSNLNWAAAGHTIDTDIDFNHYEAVRMVCDNDTVANIPTTGSEVDGQWFYANDVQILYIYEGGWNPIISFGAINLYVDGTLGSDAVGQGFTSGAGAFATIQYAVDNIPGLNGGDVTVNVASGTYTEDLRIGGKNFTTSADITFLGARTALYTSSGGEVWTAGSDLLTTDTTGHGTVQVVGAGWTVNAYVGKLAYCPATGEMKVIRSNTTDTITIVGKWGGNRIDLTSYSAPSGTLIIYDFDVTLRPSSDYIEIRAGQSNITFENLNLESNTFAIATEIREGATLSIFNSRVDSSVSFYAICRPAATLTIWNSYVEVNNSYIVATGGTLMTGGAWFHQATSNQRIINLVDGANGNLRRGTLYSSASGNASGVLVERGASALLIENNFVDLNVALRSRYHGYHTVSGLSYFSSTTVTTPTFRDYLYDDVQMDLRGIDGLSSSYHLHTEDDSGNTIIHAQNDGAVGIGTLAPVTDMALDVDSMAGSPGALGLPRMTTAERTALAPTNSMVVYDSTLNTIYAYANSAWIAIPAKTIGAVATIPASAVAGDFFFATDILTMFEWTGTTWKPLISYGAVTIYVDGTNGTDASGYGYASGTGAFATMQYAWDQIPAISGGDVILSVANGTYAEDMAFGGKSFSGAYSITIVPTTGMVALVASQPFTSATQGARSDPSTFGTVTLTGAGWTANAYRMKLCYNSGLDEYRVIYSNTTDTITICGQWSGTPTGNFAVYDWGVLLRPASSGEKILIDAAQININFERVGIVSFATHTWIGVSVASQAVASFTYCGFDQTMGTTSARAIGGSRGTRLSLYYCSFDSPYGGVSGIGSFIRLDGCYFRGNGTVNKYGAYCQGGGDFNALNGCVFDGYYIGVLMQNGASKIGSYSNYINCTTGMEVSDALIRVHAGDFYSGNTVDLLTYNAIVSGYLDINGIGNSSATYNLKLSDDGTLGTLVRVDDDGGVYMLQLKSGATAVAAGAGTGELWVTSGHATLPDNVLMVG